MTEILRRDSSDDQIVALIRRRDEAGLAALLRRHRATLRWLHRRYDDAVGADEVEAAFFGALFRVWRFIGTFDPSRGSLRTWLRIITRREVLDRLAADQRGPSLQTLGPDVERIGAARGPSPHLAADVEECLRRLSPLERDVLSEDLRSCRGVASSAALAARLRTSRDTVYTARSSARRKMRRLLLRRGYRPFRRPAAARGAAQPRARERVTCAARGGRARPAVERAADRG